MFCKEGDRFEQSFIVSEMVYEGFKDVFGDQNPLHTNDAFAKQKGFKEKVMHGNILNGFLSYFIGECLPVKDVVIQSQEIAFHQPVYLGDVLLFEAVVKDVHESVKTVLFTFRFIGSNGKAVSKGKIQIGVLQ